MQPNLPEKNWLLPRVTTPHQPLTLSAGNDDIPEGILTILANRGINGSEEIKNFLNPTLELLPSPHLLLGLDRAVKILADARELKNPVLIHGDYDADGVTATALLVKFLRKTGLQVYHHLPDRLTEGYGLNGKSLVNLRNLPGIADSSTPILVTVDCGIGDITEIALARKLGFKVVITDHHQPGPQLPEADAIINPHQPGCAFPCKELAGVGVAFYLAAGLRAELVRQEIWKGGEKPNLKEYLDLVAIGSVADMVPLRGANRVLVKAGLEVINKSPTPGIRALLIQLNQGQGKVTAETLGFYLAPHLNAAGRLGTAENALKVLLTEDVTNAKNLAELLGETNQRRKELTEKTYLEARSQVDKQLCQGDPALVVTGIDWHPGIVGLVAARLSREYCRPSVAFVVDSDGIARGSVRSVEGIDIHKCLKECAVVLEKFGGHSQAAGVTFKAERIDEFKVLLLTSVAKATKGRNLVPSLEIDVVANPNEIVNDVFLKYLQRLEPFGNGNREPIFCTRQEGLKLTHIKKIGSSSLRFTIPMDGHDVKGIGFGLSEWQTLAKNESLNLAYKLFHSNFRGNESWEIRLADVKKLQ